MTYDEKVDRIINALIEASCMNSDGEGAAEVHAAFNFFMIAIVTNIESEHQVSVFDQLVAVARERLPVTEEIIH